MLNDGRPDKTVVGMPVTRQSLESDCVKNKSKHITKRNYDVVVDTSTKCC